jgi:hypothetical protein
MKILLNKFWSVLSIVILWLVFSWPYVAKGLVPFPSTYLVTFFPPWNASYGMPVKNNAMPDTISQIYPWKKLTIDTWKSGRIPLWNPYSFSGTTHAANYQSAVFSPFNLLFFVLPFIDAWSLLILLQPLIAGIGMYVFLRAINRSKYSSLLGAVAFMFCGFMTAWMAYGTLGYAAAFLPWALWGVAMNYQKDSYVSRFCVALSIMVSFLSGHFQISLYVLATIIGYIVYKSLQTKNYKRGFILGFYVLCGLLMVTPQLLLTYDAYRISTRSTSFVAGEVIPWSYLVTLFSPDFFGNPVTRNDWFGHYAEWASYIGAIPLVFTFFAIRNFRKSDKIFFLALGIIAFLLAYPTPFSDFLFRLKIPAVSTSAASRIMILFSFALAGLSAFGLDDLVQVWKEKRMKKIVIFSGCIILIAGCIWGIIIFGKPFALDKLLIARRNIVLPTVFASLTLILMLLGFIRNALVRTVIITGFILITAFDMYRFASKWMPFESRAFIYPQEKSLSFLQTHIGNNRVFGNIGNETGGMFQLPLIEGYDAMYQGRYAEFLNAVSSGYVTSGDRSVVQFDKYGIYRTEALQLLGVRYIYHRLSDGRNIWAFPYWDYISNGSMKQVYNDEKYWIYEYTDVFPRAFLADGYKIVNNKQDIISTLFSKDFDRRNTLVLEEKPDIEPQKGPGTAEIVTYSPNNISVKIQSESPKLLFLSDVYDAGWNATVDGKPVHIYRADYDFRAVGVPSGNHLVQFQYAPRSLIIGIALTVVGILLLVVSKRFL